METIQAVILAGGKGTRMLPLTTETPKPMLSVSGKNLIEWKLEALPENVSSIILVVGYLGTKVRDYFGSTWKGKPIYYVEQEVLNGSGGALWLTKEFLKGRFIVMMGDDLYDREGIKQLLNHEIAIGGYPVVEKETRGELLVDEFGNFIGIKESPHFVERGYINTGLYVLDTRIFSLPLQLISVDSVEYGLPHTLLPMGSVYPIKVIPTKRWFQITTPDDLKKAEDFLRHT